MTGESQLLEGRPPWRRPLGMTISLGLLILASLEHAYFSVAMIPKFMAIFNDMGLPLPASTAIVLKCRWLFVCLDCVWPLAASFVVLRKGSRWYLIVISVLFLVETAFSSIPLFLPLIGHIESVGAVAPSAKE